MEGLESNRKVKVEPLDYSLCEKLGLLCILSPYWRMIQTTRCT